MLENNDRKKIEDYINKLLNAIYSDIRKDMDNGKGSREVIDSAINLTVNKLTPESKMILSSAYNMMMEKTLAKTAYQNAQNKAAFYSKDILKQLNSKFSFDVPNHIDYEETRKLLNKWIASGAIVVAGGVISIHAKSFTPIAIATVIAGIMLFLLKGQAVKTESDIEHVIKDYLKNVKDSLMAWMKEIENFYDEEVAKLEKELDK